jgi:hypothetical protein
LAHIPSDYTPAYIRTHSNIADQFTKIVDPVSFRRLRDWMANGLDDQWDGEVVETLEKLFQQCKCKMREMAARKATQREQLKDKQASSKREQPLQQELIKTKRRKFTSNI